MAVLVQTTSLGEPKISLELFVPRIYMLKSVINQDIIA